MSTAGNFRERAAAAQSDARMIHAIHLATLHKVEAREASLRGLLDAEAVRELAANIRRHTLAHLPHYLEQFSAAVRRGGGTVHFAETAADACRIVCEIARRRGTRLAVKSKSMVTEEIRLNEALEAAGVRVVETDLGEFIVQIDRDRPSHIVTPIIHKDRRQVAAALRRETGCRHTEDPRELTQIARAHLRELFRRCDLGISGVNFGVAQTGTLCICTNEGNARMTVSRPDVHVAVMGVERLVPRMRDLVPFLKLLARSSTGQPLTVYTTLITGPRRAADSDGPRELHVVLVDNGRRALLGGPFEDVLRCIRCGACLNACPVYRNVGGHAYGGVYPGPIGALLAPLLSGMRDGRDLAGASSLCGACAAACPVKIDIPGLLVKLREQAADEQPAGKRLALRLWRRLAATRQGYEFGQWALRALFGGAPDGWIRELPGPLSSWTQVRDLPDPPASTFRRLWREWLRDES